MKRALAKLIPILLAVSIFLVAPTLGQDDPGKSAEPPAAPEANAGCLACHSPEAQGAPAVDPKELSKSPHAAFACTDCHSSITETPHTPEMTKHKAACSTCHSEQTEAFLISMHSNKDFVKGDHPSCMFCHGGGKPHAITAGSKWTREQKVQVCTQCHEQQDIMQRYHVDAEAVSSYNDSFHGKALLRFKDPQKTAICTDCHGHHDVLSPMNPKSPTHPNNVAATCGQTGCHPGAKANFAISGANHLRLKVKEKPLLFGILIFFRILIFGTIAFMVTSIGLDLYKVAFRSKEPPRCGKPAATFISLSYLLLVLTIILATISSPLSTYIAYGTLGCLVIAFIIHALRPKGPKPAEPQQMFERMNLNLRLQHFLLFLSVTTLMVTGMPLRFSQADGAAAQLALVGGLENARYIHRVAAFGLIAVAIWHVGYLLLRWKKYGGGIRTWRMLPNKKDVQDFIQVTKTYVGLSHEEPKFDHYTFRSKIDYLAEYWGVPLMILTGFILWYPMYFSTRLPEDAWPIAFIAHGYEATLAFLAVICWHLNYVLFHPNVFPFNPVAVTGKISREEMEREHAYELELLEASVGPDAEAETDDPSKDKEP